MTLSHLAELAIFGGAVGTGLAFGLMAAEFVRDRLRSRYDKREC